MLLGNHWLRLLGGATRRHALSASCCGAGVHLAHVPSGASRCAHVSRSRLAAQPQPLCAWLPPKTSARLTAMRSSEHSAASRRTSDAWRPKARQKRPDSGTKQPGKRSGARAATVRALTWRSLQSQHAAAPPASRRRAPPRAVHPSALPLLRRTWGSRGCRYAASAGCSGAQDGARDGFRSACAGACDGGAVRTQRGGHFGRTRQLQRVRRSAFALQRAHQRAALHADASAAPLTHQAQRRPRPRPDRQSVPLHGAAARARRRAAARCATAQARLWNLH